MAATGNTASFLDSIQAEISSYVPTIESILAVGVSLFDPDLAPLVQVGETIANAIIADLEGLASAFEKTAAAGAPADARAPQHVGTTKRGVVVSGYKRAQG